MGIRYFAVAFHDQDVETAHEWRRVQDEANRLHDLWSKDEIDVGAVDREEAGLSYYDDPRTLDLDKSWGHLQGVLDGTDAFNLVAGDVKHTDRGWISHFAILTASEVAAAAAALEAFDEARVKAAVRAMAYSADRADEDADYVWHHLVRAREFTKRLALHGHALAAWIG